MGRLRLAGRAEGASLLLLVGVAVPLKYLAGVPAGVRVLGPVHGILFVLYFVLLVEVLAGAGRGASGRGASGRGAAGRDAGRPDADGPAAAWSTRRTLLAVLAALVPFGPFLLLDRALPPEESGATRAAGEPAPR